MFSQRKLRSHLMNKIHAVDFRLDGSGLVNILDTDVTRDPAKLELRQESMQQTEDGAIIIRRFDLTDEEKHRQMEREIFEEPKSAEEKLRAGDPAASLEIVSKAKSKAAPKSEAASSSSGIAQVIGDAVSQFIKPKMKDQATMIQPKPAPQLPKVSTATGTSPMASPKPSPPPTPKSAIGSPKPDPPALPAEAADQPMPKALPFKAPPPTLTTTSPRAPPQKSSAPAAAPSTEPRLPRRSRLWQVLLPRERVDLSLRLNRLCDHRDTPIGTFSHRERASAGSSPSGAQNCLAFGILDI